MYFIISDQKIAVIVVHVQLSSYVFTVRPFKIVRRPCVSLKILTKSERILHEEARPTSCDLGDKHTVLLIK